MWEMLTRRRPTVGDGKGQQNHMAIMYAMANGEQKEIYEVDEKLSKLYIAGYYTSVIVSEVLFTDSYFH